MKGVCKNPHFFMFFLPLPHCPICFQSSKKNTEEREKEKQTNKKIKKKIRIAVVLNFFLFSHHQHNPSLSPTCLPPPQRAHNPYLSHMYLSQLFSSRTLTTTSPTAATNVAADPIFFSLCLSAHSLLANLPLSAASALAFFAASSFSRLIRSRSSCSTRTRLNTSLPRIFC